MREELFEIVVQRLVLVRKHSERRVVAHRADGFLAVHRHRGHDELDVLLRVAEGLLAVEHPYRALQRRGLFGLDLVELVADALDPLRVGFRPGERVLELLVVDDPALLQIDEEHLAGLQAPLLDDSLLGHGQAAAFRAHDHEVVRSDDVARGPQAVPVERRPYLAPVRKRYRSGSVPRLHHRGVIFVECAPCRVHQRVVLPSLGDHHHHRVRDRIPSHHQEFERVVERSGIRLPVVDQRPDFLEVSAEYRARDRALARADPVDVAPQGVDLAVVADHAERVRQVPGREGVRGETLVHQRERGFDARVLQVLVVLADLVREQHALVARGARRHRGDVKFLAVRELERLDRVARALSDDVELALQRVGDGHSFASPDEHLPDHRLDPFRRFREIAVVHGNVPPAEQGLALVLDRALDLVLAGKARGRVARQKNDTDTVLARRGQLHTLLCHDFAQELVGDLDEQACPVRELGIPAHCAAVGEIAQYRETLLDDRMRFLALDMGDKTHAAGVMLVGGVVQTLGLVENHAVSDEWGLPAAEIPSFRASRGRAFDYTCVPLLPQVLRADQRSSTPRYG